MACSSIVRSGSSGIGKVCPKTQLRAKDWYDCGKKNSVPPSIATFSMYVLIVFGDKVGQFDSVTVGELDGDDVGRRVGFLVVGAAVGLGLGAPVGGNVVGGAVTGGLVGSSSMKVNKDEKNERPYKHQS